MLLQNFCYRDWGAAKQNDVARVFIDHVNDDKSVDKKEVCRDLFLLEILSVLLLFVFG